MTRRALITGITGQDGSYLAEFLLDKGYEVVGMVRRSSTVNYERIAHLMDSVQFHSGDLLDQLSMVEALKEHTSRTRSTTWQPSRSSRRRSNSPS